MPGVHARYSPSKLSRIIQCPGSVNLSVKLAEETESSYASEGTMLHDVTAEALAHNSTIQLKQVLDNNLNAEQIEAVTDILNYVIATKMSHNGSGAEFIEAEVSLAGYARNTGCPALEDVYGTLDYCLTYSEDRVLYVEDWKFGKGIEVFPDTPQLKAYALGVLDRIGNDGYYVNHQLFDKVVMVIGQPRIYGAETFKTEEYTPKELMEWLHNTLIPALNNIDATKPVLNPSVDACRWCRAKNTCKARKGHAHEIAESVFAVHAKLPCNTSPEEVGNLLVQAKELRQYLADLELYAIDKITRGEEFPGFKVVAGRSIRKWENESSMVAYLSTLGYSREEISVTKLMSPTQVGKKVSKEEAKNKAFQALIIKPPGKNTLVPVNDKRKALEFGDAESKFADFVKEEE